MTKFASLKKNPHKNYHREKKSGVERSGISLLFSKSMPWLLRIYIGPFFNLYITLPWYHQNEKLMKQLIFETFASCSQISFRCFYGILAPHFQTGKTKRKIINPISQVVVSNSFKVNLFWGLPWRKFFEFLYKT